MTRIRLGLSYISGLRNSLTGAAFRIAACLLAVLCGFSAQAVAGSVSFPITLDPTVPDAWIVASNIHECFGGCTDFGDEETYLTGGKTSLIGILSGPLVVAGGVNAGAFSDLTHGAMGVGAAGFSDGSGAGVVDYLVVNAEFSGTGQSTVNFNIAASGSADACANLFCEASLGAILSIYSPVPGATIQLTNRSSSCVGPDSTCKGIPSSQDLSLTFSIDSAVDQIIQFTFFLSAQANGFASVDARHTGLISFDLGSGVAMDTTSGFLTQPGEPNFGGPTTVPEPSPASLLVVAGLAAFSLLRRRRKAT